LILETAVLNKAEELALRLVGQSGTLIGEEESVTDHRGTPAWNRTVIMGREM